MRDVAREARQALRRCKQRGAPTQVYNSDDGCGKEGWPICIVSFQDGSKFYSNAPGDFEEWWGNGALFLGTDGKIYKYEFRGHEWGSGRSEGPKTVLTHKVALAHVAYDIRYPQLPFGERKPAFQAVLEGLKILPR
jgi:hypothetical protein